MTSSFFKDNLMSRTPFIPQSVYPLQGHWED